MSNLTDDLRAAFDSDDDDSDSYDVRTVEENRSSIRILLNETDVTADAAADRVYDVVSEDDVLGLSVETEAISGHDDLVSVVSFRYLG